MNSNTVFLMRDCAWHDHPIKVFMFAEVAVNIDNGQDMAEEDFIIMLKVLYPEWWESIGQAVCSAVPQHSVSEVKKLYGMRQ